jgi:hypothetical protein
VNANDAGPGTLGEILDRAIALVARRWAGLFAILACAAVPVALVQFAAQPALAHIVDAAGRLGALPPADSAGRASATAALTHALAPSAWVVLFVLAEVVLFPLAQTAAFAFLARDLAGERPTVAGAFRAALPRLPAQIGVLVAFAGFAWLSIVPIAFAALIVAVDRILLERVSGGLASIVAFLVVCALVGAVVVGAAGLYLAWLIASASVATEGAGPVRAVKDGVRRVLDPALRRRTFAIAPTLLGVNWFATLAVVSFGSVVAGAAHADALAVAVPALAGIAIDGARDAFVQVYVDDLRRRREGRDLVAAADALAHDTADADADGLVPAERTLIAAFLERRAALDPAAAAALAARIAGGVRPKLRASFHYLDDVALLEHLSRSRG